MSQTAFSTAVPFCTRNKLCINLSRRRKPLMTTVPKRSPRFTSLISVDRNYNDTIQPIGESIIDSADGTLFRDRAIALANDDSIPRYVADTLLAWYGTYRQAVADNRAIDEDPTVFTERMFSTLLELSRRAIADPFVFNSYHERVRQPFDYYKFGFDFASVLFNRAESILEGMDNLARAEAFAQQGHNVVFLSNHQSEGDPYAIDYLFDWIGERDRSFCENVIFMAGDRVRNDPVVSPFSAGRNLLTVYSKKHINDIPEEREGKLLHNRRTISETQRMFKQGGKVVWFAPSGGRDRRSTETGSVEIAPFDEGAVDMMRFTSLKSGKPCHFFPMALWTYDMLPPPSNVGGSQLGEERIVKHTPMHMFVGDEIDWTKSVPDGTTDKFGLRKARCSYVERIVREGYDQIGGYRG